MQLNFRVVSALTLSLFFTLASCKKDTVTPPDSAEEVKAHSDDQNFISGELDVVSTDIGLAMETEPGFSGRMQREMETNDVCGASAVVDLNSNPRKITITYNGNSCSGTHRSGSIVISMASGVKWKDAGAAVTVTFQNLKIKRLSDNRSITINGTQTHTNVSGGLFFTLAGGGELVHTVDGDISVKFDDNTSRNWQIARKRKITKNPGLVVTISGNHSVGNLSGIAEWGTNRFGHAFTTTITEPLVFRQDCNGRLTSGKITHQGFATASVTFGLNATGESTGCPTAGTSYFYKISWTGPQGNTHNWILPY